jgi:competence protein ComEC
MPAGGWLAIGSVVAALAGGAVSPAVLALVAASLAIGVRCIGPQRPGSRRISAVLAVAVGAFALAIRLLLGGAPPLVASALPAGDGPWNATVESIGPVRDGSQVATLRVAGPEAIRIAATLPRFPEIEPGFTVVVDGGLRPPPPDDPYGDYLRRSGIAGTLRSRSLELRPSELTAAVALERMRRSAAAAVAAAIPEPEAGLAAGIVIGLRDRVDRDLAADFTTVGASHVVAISGWNIAIVAASVAALGGGLARRRRALLTAAAIVAYVAFAGASPSVVRAAVMAGVVLIARESGRAGRAAAALGWAALILLLVDPRLVADAGFQLSTVATGGILAWATPLTAWLTRVVRGRLPGWLIECLGVSLAAQAATLPIVLVTFGRLALVSPIVNLAIVPLVAPAMAASALALIGGLIAGAGAPAAIATILGLPGWFLLSVIVGVIHSTARLPFASATLEPPWTVVLACVAGAIPTAIQFRRHLGWSRRSPRRASSPIPPAAGAAAAAPRRTSIRTRRGPGRAVAIGIAGSLIALTLAVVHRPDGSTRITVLDVGQGDAILVEGGRGGRLLVDGGPDPDRLLIELDRRLPPWDRRIDAVVLTHPHEDHVAGLALLLTRYRIGRVFEPGMHGPGPGYAAWASFLKVPGAPPRARLVTGDRLAVDDLAFRVLWPDPGRVPDEPSDGGRAINDVSIVLLGEVDGRRILLTGDVEDDVDPILTARGLPPVDLLKVAHHGSRTASTVAFLGVVRPSVAVVSAGTDNPYGHPARTTLEHLRETGAQVLRTDQDGSVEIAFGGGAMTVYASGGPSAATEPESRTAVGLGAGALGATGATGTVPFSCAVPSSG